MYRLFFFSLFIFLIHTLEVKAQSTQPKHWKEKFFITSESAEAELVVRTGDIDNLGYGWPKNFNPFSGMKTPIHNFMKWKYDRKDPQGTDAPMAISSYKGRPRFGSDGYVKIAKSKVKPVLLDYSASNIEIKSATLQLFVDDFQSPHYKSRYKVFFNDTRIYYLENIINELRQGGPIGKLLTVEIWPQYLDILKSGKLKILIDDNTTGAGDGYAIDFVRLLINPTPPSLTGMIRGQVIDQLTKKPIEGAYVSTPNLIDTTTDQSGCFLLKNIPTGITIINVYKQGYKEQKHSIDIIDKREVKPIILLSKQKQLNISLEKPFILENVLFEINQSQLMPSSFDELDKLIQLLQERKHLKILITGHTDNQGDATSNIKLSILRAEAVATYLEQNGILSAQIKYEGKGSTIPIANNGSEYGRSRNRRVEVEIIK